MARRITIVFDEDLNDEGYAAHGERHLGRPEGRAPEGRVPPRKRRRHHGERPERLVGQARGECPWQ
jgi:hypothetical protein